MTENTLKITFGTADEHRDAAHERLRRAESGETGDAIEQDVRFVLDFEEFGDIERLVRQTNLELLETIVTDRPTSIREAAEAVGRDYRDVHRNLTELESLGVVEFTAEGTRKRPILRGGAEEVDISVTVGDADADGSRTIEA